MRGHPPEGLSLCSDRKQHLTLTAHGHIFTHLVQYGQRGIVGGFKPQAAVNLTRNLSKTLALVLHFQTFRFAFRWKINSAQADICTAIKC